MLRKSVALFAFIAFLAHSLDVQAAWGTFNTTNGSGTHHNANDNNVAPGDPLTSQPIDMTSPANVNFIVVACGHYPHNTGANTTPLANPGVTDSSGNHYAKARNKTYANNATTTGDAIEVWYTDQAPITVTSSMTFNCDATASTYMSITVAGFVATTVPQVVDQSTENYGSSLSMDGGTTGTTTAAEELVIGAGTHTGVTFLAGGFAPGTNMADAGEFDQSTVSSTSYINYRIVSSTGTYASPETVNGTSNTWGAQTITFKANVVAATLSSPTPSGTLGTTTTATVGASTDQTSGTFYSVVDTSGNLSGVTATQIKAGQKASGSAALAACNASVSASPVTCGVTGLTAGTAYAYASVQNNTNGDSNVVTGTFTTGTSGILAKFYQQIAANDWDGGLPLVENAR